MALIRVTCELRYATQMSLLRGHEDLYRRILGEEPKERQQWLTPGLRIDHRERKEVVIVDPQRTLVELHEPASPKHGVDTVRQRIHVVEEIFSIPDVARWGSRTIWITPFKGSFQTLMDVFREKAFGGFRLAREASDVAFVFEFHGGDGSEKVNVSCGPMWPEQLRERYVSLSTSEFPDMFVLVDVDLGATAPQSYSRPTLGKFLEKAIQVGERYSKACFEALLGGAE